MARSRGRRSHPPVTVTLDRLEPKHASGLGDDDRRHKVRGAGVGDVVRARRGKKGTARLLEVLTPAPDAVAAPCPAFGVCGGCQLQTMPLDRQRVEKARLVRRQVGIESDDGACLLPAVRCHPVRGADRGYGYRNKVELSWSTQRYVPEGVDPSAVQTVGSFLGFHPPGWWSKVVPLSACALASDTMNAVVAAVTALDLGPAWDSRAHTGAWRHLVLREGGLPEDPQVWVTFVTTSTVDAHQLERAGAAAAAVPGVAGVLHVVNDGVAEVARGELRRVLAGTDTLTVKLGAATLELPHDAFFQVNSEGAEVLVETIAEAAGLGAGPPATLVDLYCGVGAIGLALSDRVAHIIGIEVHEGAVVSARANAARMGISARFEAGPVEHVLPGLDLGPRPCVVVDPPRAGLHPKAAAFLAAYDGASVLVYVACGPASLGRDREVLEAGGWRLTDLWTVDLFPQTHHVEAVARFERAPVAPPAVASPASDA